MARLKAAAGLDPKDLEFALMAGSEWAAQFLLRQVANAERIGRWNPLDREDAAENAALLGRLAAARGKTAKTVLQDVTRYLPQWANAVPGALAFIAGAPVA